jgi:hypothetical protein
MKGIKTKAKKYRDLILILIPLIVATLIVVFNMVPAEILGLFSDAYTVALLLILVLITALATMKK